MAGLAPAPASGTTPIDLPMEIDGGIASLEQSRHHPNAALKAVNDLTKVLGNGAPGASTSTSAETGSKATLGASNGLLIKGLLDQLIKLVPEGLKGQARGIAKEVMMATQAAKGTPKEGGNNKDATSHDWEEMRKMVVEEAGKAAATAVKELLSEVKKTTETGATWSAVAARGAATAMQQQDAPKKVIPARQSREMLIRGYEMPPSLAKRTPQEIVQAINTASAQKGAVAARALPSGDVVVTFKDEATRDWHRKDTAWIRGAFGEQAKEAVRTVAILIKGLRKEDLQGVTEEDLVAELGLESVDKAKIRLPSIPEHNRATVRLALTDQEEARRACDNGVVWRAQIFNCEPYSATLEAVQCYKCWQWGHTQRFCRKDPLCPRCGTQAHGPGGREGENLCPTHKGVTCRCPACGGPHTAWAKECAKGAEAKRRAKEAYQYRPRTFQPVEREKPKTTQQTGRPLAIPATPRRQAAPQLPMAQPRTDLYSDEGEDDGFQEVRRKRGRGRPTGLENAAQSPTQRRLIFPATARTQLPPSQLSAAQSDRQTQPGTGSQTAGTTTEECL